jgi:hypothetical protein
VYDHLQPPARPDTLGEEPLFARLTSGDPSVGLPDGGRDVAKVPRQIGVVGLDVKPALLRQDDATTVRVEHGGDHVVKIEDRSDGA